MTNSESIKGVDFDKYRAQRTETRKLTEKSINSLNISAQDKKTLLSAYLSGILDFGDNGLTENEARELQSDIQKAKENGDDENNPLIKILKNIAQYKQKQQSKTMYIVQAGDTPESIAKKLCNNTKNTSNSDYNAVLRQIKQHMNGNKWLKVGEMICIDGDFTDAIQVMKDNNQYKNTSSEIVKDYKEKTKPKEEKPIEDAEENTASSEKAKALIQSAKTFVSRFNSSANSKIFKDNINAVTEKNAAFVAQMFEKQTGTSIISIGLLKSVDMAFLRDNFGKKLALRAQQLNLTGVYYRELFDAKTPEQLIQWVKMASEKIIEAEKNVNPVLYFEYENTLKNLNTQQSYVGIDDTEKRDSIRDYSPKAVESTARTPEKQTPKVLPTQAPVIENPEVPISQGKIVGDRVGGPKQLSFTVPEKEDPTIKSPQKTIVDAYNEAEKIAENIRKAINAFKNDKSKENIENIKIELAKINKLNVAKILDEITDLAQQIIDIDFWGFGLDESDADKYILQPLIQRAKELNMYSESIIKNCDIKTAISKFKRQIYYSDCAKINEYNKQKKEYNNYTIRYDNAIAAFTDMNEHLGNLITNENSPSVEKLGQYRKSKAGLYARIRFGDNKFIHVTVNEKSEITKLEMLDSHDKASLVIYTPFKARYKWSKGGNIIANVKNDKNPLNEYDFTKMCQCVYKVLPELRPNTSQA